MTVVHQYIADNHSHVPNFKAMIYSGDNDTVCATLGTEYWIFPLFGKNITKDYSPW